MKNLTIVKLFTLMLLLLLVSCASKEKKWHIGVSQCSEDAWRGKLNKELIIGGYANSDMQLDIVSADDDDQKQISQIERFIADGVDLLIVSPNSANALTPVIEKAYDKGIPVIIFDRRTNSDKYTMYMGADNYEIGNTMGHLIARKLEGKGTLAELKGLAGSSAAIERHRGFTAAISEYPEIKVLTSDIAGWKTEYGEKAMEDIIKRNPGIRIDCIFGHNDRLALGARTVCQRHGMSGTKYYGVDGLPTPGGGIENVVEGRLEATYIYPTHGLEMLALARKILTGEKTERKITLHSAVVDKEYAPIMLMEYQEMERASEELEILYGKVDEYFSQVNMQRKVIIAAIAILIIIITLTLLTYRSYLTKARLNEELSQRNDELSRLYRQLEDMADARMVFFTNVGHKLRTPLTLIAGPTEQLYADTSIQGEKRSLVDMIHRNMQALTKLVDEILDFRKIGNIDTTASGQLSAGESEPEVNTEQVEATTTLDDDKPVLLVVDDNADIRKLLVAILQEKYNVTLAANGKEGYERAKEIVPDLIVSDVMMPVMDGLEMCSNVKADTVTSHIPVLMLTARTLDEHRVEGYLHGADAYITKPFTSSLLLARIENLLASRHALRKAFSSEANTPNDASANDTQKGESAAAVAVEKSVPSPRDSAFMKRLDGIMQKNISNADFGVEPLCAEIGMSRVQLYRKVKALTGLSPVELLRKARVEKGRRMLMETDMTVSEIAYACGFSAPSYFTKCYRDEYGITPGETRSSGSPSA